MVINATSATLTAPLRIIEDGHIVGGTPRPGYEVKTLEDGRIEGLGDKSREIIERLQLNGPEEVYFRQRLRRFNHLIETLDECQRRPCRYFRSSLCDVISFNRTADQYSFNQPDVLRRMLYANVISALEAWFSDLLIASIKGCAATEMRFIDRVDFARIRKEKWSFKELIANNKSGKELLVEELEGLVYHNLGLVEHLYSSAFMGRFKAPDWLHRAVSTRHDIVHRNGRMHGTEETVDIEKHGLYSLLRNSLDLGCTLVKDVIVPE